MVWFEKLRLMNTQWEHLALDGTQVINGLAHPTGDSTECVQGRKGTGNAAGQVKYFNVQLLLL